MRTNQRRCLVTGGSGFLGRQLVRALLADGHEVHALSRSARAEGPCLTHTADLTNPARVREVVQTTRPEVIYHLAAGGVVAGLTSRAEAIAVNAAGTANLLDALDAVEYHALV